MSRTRRGVHRSPNTEKAVADYVGMVARHRVIRMNSGPEMSLRFGEFRQVIRRYPPSELLPALARLALVGGSPPYTAAVLSAAVPWAIALAARECVLWGNEYRNAEVTGDSLRVIMNAHNNIYEDQHYPTENSALDILIRLAYEQFPYQESIFEEISRSHALMVQGPAEIATEVLNGSAWAQLLGAPLGEVVGATFFLQVATNDNDGWFDHAWLDRDDLQPIYKLWRREVIEARADQLSSTFDEFKEAYAAVPRPPPGYERYAYNPLLKRPLLRMPGGLLLAPQPALIMRTVSPGALYYRGMEEFDQPFARDLGHLTEHYVGRQLRSITPGPDLHPEIVYREGRDELKSIDWFLVFPSVVIMFEVKSARFGLLERAAFGDYQDKVKALLNKATEQLDRSSQALAACNPAFAHVPRDRPRIGIIVTNEPYYLANSPLVREMLTEVPFPTLTASLRDIEFLVTLPLNEVERQLVAIANDRERSTWNLGNSLDASARSKRNVILQDAWEAYPWPKALNVEQEDGHASGAVSRD